MSICNIFNEFNKPTGNILMFSQYTKDLTKGNARDESYKIIPSKFMAMDIDYNSISVPMVGDTKNLNIDIPTFFQNFYENACAYCESNIEEPFTPNNAKSLFWNAMDISNMIGSTYTEGNGFKKYNNSYIQYIGNINMQSFDEYNGMGYSEIFCYIPAEHEYKNYNITYIDGEDHVVNPNNTIEGYEESIDKYSKSYYKTASIQLEEVSPDTQPVLYNINTIVILYDIYSKNIDGDYIKLYDDVPMGMYFTGVLDENNGVTNSITKYISNEDAYGMGTSYGLRICSRFTVTPNNININSIDVNSDGNNNYSAFCQVMTKMSENIDKMNEVISNSFKVQQNLQDMLAIFKNNRINTPYIKEIAGKSYWFVNGKLIGESVLIEGMDINRATDQQISNIKDRLLTELEY